MDECKNGRPFTLEELRAKIEQSECKGISSAQRDKLLKFINGLDQAACAWMVRFARSGHPVFRSDFPYYVYFMERFKQLGGMTPEISKRLGFAPGILADHIEGDRSCLDAGFGFNCAICHGCGDLPWKRGR